MHKGSMLYIEGKLRYRQYADREGQKKYVTEILAEQLLLDKKGKMPADEPFETAEKLLPFREKPQMLKFRLS